MIYFVAYLFVLWKWVNLTHRVSGFPTSWRNNIDPTFFLKLVLKWSKKNIEYIRSFFMPFNDKSKFSIMQWWSFRFQLINVSKSRNNYLNINMAVVSHIKSKEVERAYTLLETCLCYAYGHSLMTRNILKLYDNIMQFLWIQVRSIKGGVCPPPPTFWHRKDFS